MAGLSARHRRLTPPPADSPEPPVPSLQFSLIYSNVCCVSCNSYYMPPTVSPRSPRWLLLAFQLPAKPSNARVKTWRRLVQLGAVLVRNAVYALPNTEQSREDFEWMRSEIASMGGGATVFVADAADSAADA